MVFCSDLPRFCLERWQSERETRARILLSESGVEPLSLSLLKEYGVNVELLSVELGYGWTKGSPGLRSVIAEYYDDAVTSEHVLVTVGSSEANFLSVMSTVKPEDAVVVDMPAYMQVHGLLEARGARLYMAWRSSENEWELPLADLLEFIRTKKPKAIYLVNPNNPTGRIAGEKALREVAREASKTDTIIVVDEVYRGLEHSGPPTPSIVSIAVEEGATAVSTGGLSKSFGLPGLRIGWLVSNKLELVERAWSAKDYTTISPPRLSELIAEKVLAENTRSKLLERAKNIVRRNVETLKRILEKNKDLVKAWWPEAGAFVLASLPWAKHTMHIAERLFTEYGILVNPGECFEVPGTLRIGLGVEDHDKAMKTYQELLMALNKLKSTMDNGNARKQATPVHASPDSTR